MRGLASSARPCVWGLWAPPWGLLFRLPAHKPTRSPRRCPLHRGAGAHPSRARPRSLSSSTCLSSPPSGCPLVLQMHQVLTDLLCSSKQTFLPPCFSKGSHHPPVTPKPQTREWLQSLPRDPPHVLSKDLPILCPAWPFLPPSLCSLVLRTLSPSVAQACPFLSVASLGCHDGLQEPHTCLSCLEFPTSLSKDSRALA